MIQVNEAGWDRIVRIVVGIVMLALGWSGIVTGMWGAVLQWLGFIPLLTGLFGWCPLYSIFHISTKSA
ncbi:MAG: DUF2892 domain-containing protein [Caldilinea sp.]